MVALVPISSPTRRQLIGKSLAFGTGLTLGIVMATIKFAVPSARAGADPNSETESMPEIMFLMKIHAAPDSVY
jgi:hypothetical protein